MKEVLRIFAMFLGLYWILSLWIVSTILVIKLGRYLYESPFQEWWFMFLGVLIIPLTVLTGMLFKK